MYKTALSVFLLVVSVACMFSSCSDDETYAEKREREAKQINAFLSNGCHITDALGQNTILDVKPIKVITEEEFYAQDSTTNVAANEYVLFENTGLYMQIVRRGTGHILAEGERATVVSRYLELNIATDSIKTTNMLQEYADKPDVMTVTNTYGTLTASFTSGIMINFYQSSEVPSGWITPLQFVRIGRQDAPEAEVAKVRIIVPSTEGQGFAKANTIPFFYEITYQRGR